MANLYADNVPEPFIEDGQSVRDTLTTPDQYLNTKPRYVPRTDTEGLRHDTLSGDPPPGLCIQSGGLGVSPKRVFLGPEERRWAGGSRRP